MFFDRNEIHIQAFVDFINGKLIIFQSSSPQNVFQEIYTQHIFKKIILQKIMLNYKLENQEIMEF